MSEPPAIDPDIANIFGKLAKFDSQTAAFKSATDADRLINLAAIERSVRPLVEISQLNSLMSKDLRQRQAWRCCMRARS